MKLLAEVLPILAHEMRTPLAAILGYQELLAEGIYGAVDERGREPLQRIAHSARQLLHLIDGVQEISTPADSRLSEHIETFDPAALLERAVANARADAAGRSVELAAAIPKQLPQITADPDRFCRAVDLVLAAALKASHGGTVRFSADLTGRVLRVAIEDTGISLERDDPAFLGANQHRLTGPGLRLAIVRAMAQQMRGDLTLEAQAAGTTIRLNLPLDASPPPAA